MKIYGLSGKSGTGKSYQAINLCKEKQIECIIDDGLLICGNSILAGYSAKRQPTKIGATKTALFNEDPHKVDVQSKLRNYSPESLLIIGTSDNMLRLISERLEIGEIDEIIHIADITTEEERDIAHKQRHELGKHIIPVPTFQIKPEFSGYFMYPLKIFKSFGGKATYSEKSVVRPTYSYLGDYVISEKVITDIIECIGQGLAGISQILRVIVDNHERGMNLQILVIMDLGCDIIEVATQLQNKVAEKIEMMTAFNIINVDVEVRGMKNHETRKPLEEESNDSDDLLKNFRLFGQKRW